MAAPRGLYTPVYQSLPRHPKTVRASETLKVSRHQLIGHLVCMWTWCLDSIPSDGEVLPASMVAIAAEWPERKAVQFCEALADAGFLTRHDGGYAVHEWPEYGGKVAAKQERDRARKTRSAAGSEPEEPADSRGDSAEVPRSIPVDSSVDETRRDESRSEEPLSLSDARAARGEQQPAPEPEPKPKRSRATVVDDDYRRAMCELFSDTWEPERVNEIIDAALGHTASKKWTDQQAGVRNWLRSEQERKRERESWNERSTSTARGGAPTAPGGPYAGQTRARGMAGNRRANGASAAAAEYRDAF